MSIEGKLKRIYHSLPGPVAGIGYSLYICFRKPLCLYWFLRAKIRKRFFGQIVVIGDSHAAFFSGDPGSVGDNTKIMHISKRIGEICYEPERDKRFCVVRLGAALAYNLGRYKTKVKALEKYEWLKKHFLNCGETVILAFGEIDIRTHVFKYVSDTKNYEQVVDGILDNYCRFITRVSKEGFRVFVWGPVASQKDEWYQNEAFPRCGSEVQRNHATRYFNDSLRRFCDDNGIGFMSAYYDTVDEDFRTKAEYICDQCHLGQNARPFLEKQLEKAGLQQNRISMETRDDKA